MGSVHGFQRDGSAVSTVGEDGSTTRFEAVTDANFANRHEIMAVPTSAKYLFDYWTLNDVRQDGLDATISLGQSRVPKTGSMLKAFFKVNPGYVENDKRGRVPRNVNLDAWIQGILKQQKPLVENGCNKTVEVYDYENRTYRVDLTAQSHMSSFVGTIDLGFIIDVSGSMKFPSKLIDLEDAINLKENDLDYNPGLHNEQLHFDADYSRINSKGKTEVDLTKINDNVNGRTCGEAWA